MLAVLSSLRFRVLVSMLLPSVAVLVGSFFLFNHFDQASQRAGSVVSNLQAARAVATVAGSAASRSSAADRQAFQVFQTLLGDDQLIVTRAGRTLFRGPPNPDRPQFQVSSTFPGGGEVLIVGDVDSTTVLSLKLTGVALLVLAVVVAAAVAGTRTATRLIREPVERAVEVADRAAGGDLGARMGEAGPPELQRLARAFDGMAVALEAADRRQRQFLADLAHEIATPLNAVAGLAMATVDGTVATPAARAETADLLEQEVARVRALLDALRGLPGLDVAGSGELEAVDLRALCRAVAARLAPGARAAGLQLAVDAGRRDVTVVSDPRLIDTILTNLVTNAIRYTPSGGRVDLAVRRRPGEVVVSVTDTGVGIAPADQDRIFDRFYRVDQARDRASGGSGLGLAISRRAAIALGGRIEVDSRPGAGSQFRVVLPVRPGRWEAAGGAGPEAAEAPPSTSR
ncbi:MAG: ATP-binding protein [Acidimicrobiales bacterium]